MHDQNWWFRKHGHGDVLWLIRYACGWGIQPFLHYGYFGFIVVSKECQLGFINPKRLWKIGGVPWLSSHENHYLGEPPQFSSTRVYENPELTLATSNWPDVLLFIVIPRDFTPQTSSTGISGRATSELAWAERMRIIHKAKNYHVAKWTSREHLYGFIWRISRKKNNSICFICLGGSKRTGEFLPRGVFCSCFRYKQVQTNRLARNMCIINTIGINYG